MRVPEIKEFRAPRARIAVAYSSKDRTELTQVTVARLLQETRIDLYWMDGSATDAGKALPLELLSSSPAACQLHQGVVGGPENAIVYSLLTLEKAGYDFVILMENDVALDEGWLDAMLDAHAAAQADGFNVGAVSVRVHIRRVLSDNGRYGLLFNAGGGFLALTPRAIGVVLDNYRTGTNFELRDHFLYLTGIDLLPTWELRRDSQATLSGDWMFDVMLYLHGMVVASPPISYARNIDPTYLQVGKGVFVDRPEDQLAVAKNRLTRPEQIRKVAYPKFRCERSPTGRDLVAVQNLNFAHPAIGGDGPVRFSEGWARKWLQVVGPWCITGTGKVSIDVYGRSGISVLFFGEKDGALVRVSGDNGAVFGEAKIEPGSFIETGLPKPPADSLTIHLQVTSGSVGIVGLCVEPCASAYYLNARPSLDYLLF
jgi:hypothetical protein